MPRISSDSEWDGDDCALDVSEPLDADDSGRGETKGLLDSVSLGFADSLRSETPEDAVVFEDLTAELSADFGSPDNASLDWANECSAEAADAGLMAGEDETGGIEEPPPGENGAQPVNNAKIKMETIFFMSNLRKASTCFIIPKYRCLDNRKNQEIRARSRIASALSTIRSVPAVSNSPGSENPQRTPTE